MCTSVVVLANKNTRVKKKCYSFLCEFCSYFKVGTPWCWVSIKMKFFTRYVLRPFRFNENLNVHRNMCDATYGSVRVWTTERDQNCRNSSSLSELDRIQGSNLSRVNQKSSINNETITLCEMNEPASNTQNSNIPLSNVHDSIKDDDETEDTQSCKVLNKFKVGMLIIIWLSFTGILMAKDEKVLSYHQLSVPMLESKIFVLNEVPPESRIGVKVKGAFADKYSISTNFLYIQLQLLIPELGNSSAYYIQNSGDIVKLAIVSNVSDIDTAPQLERSKTIYLNSKVFEGVRRKDSILRLQITTNLPIAFPINLAYDPTPIDKSLGVLYAAAILLGLYIMIIWEVVDRIFAAMFAATLSIAILALMNERPTMEEILTWIDVETLLLLFGMMTLVAILSETGVFDYLAVYAFKLTKGKIWPLINSLCLFTAILSAFLDNVTTLLLVGPVSFRLCEAMELNPIPVLMSMIIFSNIGGAITPIGDPPNIIVASNQDVVKSGVDFLTFTTHMSIGILFVMIQTYLQLRFYFRDINDLRTVKTIKAQESRKIIADSEPSASPLSSNPNDPNSVLQMETIGLRIRRKGTADSISDEIFQRTLHDLQGRYRIRDGILLIKSSLALAFVIICFFCHSLPYIERLSLGWTALLGAILLLILADRKSIEPILAHVEWSTLLFFAVLFVLMESMAKLGLIDWIGNQTENMILSVNEEFRLTVAILIILWVSAIVSAFVDNIPLTTMMIRVTVSLAEKKALNLPLQPLIWALSFGACLGGNGTLIGASANIVAASVAEQHGYRITFIEYFRIGFPAMLGSLVVASCYLIVCHVTITWH